MTTGFLAFFAFSLCANGFQFFPDRVMFSNPCSSILDCGSAVLMALAEMGQSCSPKWAS
ncbi:hypothetical protein [Amycolatopsis benzoatilytica]|uniref:hypothetical protein n=1 Tax=Amycolatopsis benzoatilytica TaxID=346045 RepID=UPI0012B68006|nr:hypothetical protein [Amycolatopsis benzoatilytica]